MLLPLSAIHFNKRTYKTDKPKAKDTLAYLPYAFESIYNKNSINFAHYIGFKGNSDITKEPDYYKLPQIELSDGTIHQFTPDKSQIECAQKLSEGNSVVYCAPTGTGKTAVMHFAVNKNLSNNKRTLITVPLIALANDKYREFSNIYGEKNVGILTGDRKINPNAPIVIMTTEILYNQSEDLKEKSEDIGTIVFDEAHYMADVDRGNVWENSIIASVPNDIQILCLSATIGNSDEFCSWIESLNKTQNASLIELKPQERYVPLVWQVYNPSDDNKFKPVVQYSVDIQNLSSDTLNDKQKRAISRIYQIQNNKNEFYETTKEETENIINALKTSLKPYYKDIQDFEKDFSSLYPTFEKDNINEISNLLRNENNKNVKNIYVQYQPHSDYETLINDLNAYNKLPALIFKLSRAQCDDIIENLYNQNLDLTTDDEKEQIKNIIKQYTSSGYLGKNINQETLLKGYASHHAGKLPRYRKLVEELFSKKLLKVVVATSTLGAGINMPAKSTVLSDMKYKCYNPHSQEVEPTVLTVNEFHQMAGRAGRRGIDNIGNVILYNLKSIPKKYKSEEYNKDIIDEADLAYKYIASSPDDLRSQFRPNAVMIAQYYNKYNDNSAFIDLANKSFKTFSAKDRDKMSAAVVKKFENYTQILLKQGFLYRDYKNQYMLSPKGMLLLNAQGANPLMVTSLIYDGLLANTTPESLAQIAGYIAGSDDVQEPLDIEKEIEGMLKKNLEDNSNEQVADFSKTRKIYKTREEKIIKSLKESRIPLNDIISSDNISGYILYLWTHYNQNNNDSIKNFERISSDIQDIGNDEKSRIINSKLSESNVYRVITHSISVLKQIQRICEYALNDNCYYPDSDYYENLYYMADEALDLIIKEPIQTEDIL